MMEQINARRSIRKYLSNPVPDEKILQLLDSVRIAPSGSNTQPWHFVIVKSDQIRQELAEASHNQQWMLSAPVFIVCVADIHCRIEDNIEISVDENSPAEEVKQVIGSPVQPFTTAGYH